MPTRNPTFTEIEAIPEDSRSPLEQFIHEHEPAHPDEASRFHAELQAITDDVNKLTPQERKIFAKFLLNFCCL